MLVISWRSPIPSTLLDSKEPPPFARVVPVDRSSASVGKVSLGGKRGIISDAPERPNPRSITTRIDHG